MLLGPLGGQLEGKAQDAIDAEPRHHRFLHDELAVGVGEHPAADRGIFALGVFTNDPEVDVAWLAADERRSHARHQAHGAQIDVLIELAAEFDERAPERHMVGDLGRPANRAEIDRVMAADLRLPVFRHHDAVLGVIVVGGEIEPIELKFEAETLRDLFERADAFRHNLLADAVRPG